MASFNLPPIVPVHSDTDLHLKEDNALHIWAFSPSRVQWQLVCAFLDAGYGRRHGNRMYGLSNNSDRTLTVRFVNFRDAYSLYGHVYHWGYEKVVLTRANMFTNYWDEFPDNDNFIHRVLPDLPMAVVVPPDYPEVPVAQQPAVALELALTLVLLANEMP